MIAVPTVASTTLTTSAPLGNVRRVIEMYKIINAGPTYCSTVAIPAPA